MRTEWGDGELSFDRMPTPADDARTLARLHRDGFLVMHADRNPMPFFVPFPRLAAVEGWWKRRPRRPFSTALARCGAALRVLRYGDRYY